MLRFSLFAQGNSFKKSLITHYVALFRAFRE